MPSRRNERGTPSIGLRREKQAVEAEEGEDARRRRAVHRRQLLDLDDPAPSRDLVEMMKAGAIRR
jgi:hypothetical protein